VKESISTSTRRTFLETVLPLTAGFSLSAPVILCAPGRTLRVTTTRRNAYLSLAAAEAAFMETMVNVLCPADHLTPSGVDCGLAAFIDRRLSAQAGIAKAFEAGIGAANAACHARYRTSFDRLPLAAATNFLRDITGGRVVSPQHNLSEWLDKIVNTILIEGCFSGPIYEPYGGKVFWKAFGHA